MTAKPQRCTQTTQPASQAATGERSPRPALLSRVPPLMASRDVATPTSSPPKWEPRTTELAPSLAPPRLLSQAPPPGRPMGSRPHPPPRRSLNVFRLSVGLGLLLLRGSPGFFSQFLRSFQYGHLCPLAPRSRGTQVFGTPRSECAVEKDGESDRTGSRRERKGELKESEAAKGGVLSRRELGYQPSHLRGV